MLYIFTDSGIYENLQIETLSRLGFINYYKAKAGVRQIESQIQPPAHATMVVMGCGDRDGILDLAFVGSVQDLFNQKEYRHMGFDNATMVKSDAFTYYSTSYRHPIGFSNVPGIFLHHFDVYDMEMYNNGDYSVTAEKLNSKRVSAVTGKCGEKYVFK